MTTFQRNLTGCSNQVFSETHVYCHYIGQFDVSKARIFHNFRSENVKFLYQILGLYRCADKSLARPGRKQARKHVRDACGFNNIDTRAVIKTFFLHGKKALMEIHDILTQKLACFVPGRAKDL